MSHLEYYLDEFTFRFNRRTSTSRGKLFYRLVQQAAEVEPPSIKNISTGGTKGEPLYIILYELRSSAYPYNNVGASKLSDLGSHKSCPCEDRERESSQIKHPDTPVSSTWQAYQGRYNGLLGIDLIGDVIEDDGDPFLELVEEGACDLPHLGVGRA